MQEVLDEWRPIVESTLAELLPREIDEAYLREFFGPASFRYDTRAIQGALADPVWDLLDRGGKRWRPIVCLLFLDGFGVTALEYVEYACIPEILHNGTIIVDDVEDGAEMRRGDQALHHRYGTDVALNAGNALYFLPLKILAHNPADLDQERRLTLYDMLMHELNRTHLGQGMDICWHNNPEITIEEAHYLEMCACKTGCLGRMTARIATIIAEQSPEIEDAAATYAEEMSVAFQIGDDVLDIKHTLDQAGDFGKAFGNDIQEGKKTLMVLHSMDHGSAPDAERLAEILRAEQNSREEIMEAIDIMQSTGSISYATERARSFAEQARSRLDGIGLSSKRRDELAAFADYVVERDA